jgi:hypothetical protein
LGELFKHELDKEALRGYNKIMWVYTGTSLVNIGDAQEITVDRESADDRRTVFVVAVDFGEQTRVSLARIELVYPTSLIVALDSGADGPSLSPRERAEQQARAECDTCLRALAESLASGQAYCDLSTLYTPVIRAGD